MKEPTFIDPSESFVLNDEKQSKTALDFWRWTYSDLLQNITRGCLAEYIVAWAFECEETPRNPWDAFDLKTRAGNKVEVKSTAYVQSWGSKKPQPKFIIKPTKTWSDAEGSSKKADFNADIYVLCYLKETDKEKVNPMNLDQWRFWVFSKEQLITLLNNKRAISVQSLQKQDSGITFEELRLRATVYLLDA